MIALVGSCYAEYEGMVLELDGEDSDLPAPASTFAHKHGTLWVVEDASGSVVASAGLRPCHEEPGSFELKRLYVLRSTRRMGLAAALLDHIEDQTTARGGHRLTLWSDTRLADAHRFYEKRGYVRSPHTRELHDLSNSVEYFFDRVLTPVG